MEDMILELEKDGVFVFGSNQAGVHGRGAARKALESFGAVFGQGEGLQGRSYAIPTRNFKLETLSLEEIEKHVKAFIEFAKNHLEKKFHVTAVGCGLARLSPKQIAPMFREAKELPNVFLPRAFLAELGD